MGYEETGLEHMIRNGFGRWARRGTGALVVGCLALSACAASNNATGADDESDSSTTAETATTAAARRFAPPPPVVETTDPDGANAAYRLVIDGLATSVFNWGALNEAIELSDARHAWIMSDLLRFLQGTDEGIAVVAGLETVTNVDFRDDPAFVAAPWSKVTDHLIAWDLPEPPGYRSLKGGLFTAIDDRWSFIFDDEDADIDWRWLSWGGVRIDDRPLGATEPCVRGCIPSLDDPGLVDIDDDDWYDDDALVFGIEHEGDAVAFPRNIMQVHEMVNMTIGGERVGIPYCTLCGSAQGYLTDRVPDGIETPVLRTSGLLSRSNKVMYDLETGSVFDTFTGEAVSGPLRDAGISLARLTVQVTTWGEWKAANPDTRIVAQDGGIGRTYDADPLRGRDDNGPIFPVGDVDPRLPVHEPVVGVLLDTGTALAFPAAMARNVLGAGDPVVLGGVSLVLDGGGLRAEVDGAEVAAHEAFWFAWSQFHPDTQLWVPTS